jgi:hypothetical protein
MIRLFPIVLLSLLLGCAASGDARVSPTSGDLPETVMITYQVIPGKEKELQEVLARAWTAYQNKNLILPWPHVIVQSKEEDNKYRVVEIFSWVSHAAPAQAQDSLKEIWDQMKVLCEKRNGHEGLEGGEVDLIVPSDTDRVGASR